MKKIIFLFILFTGCAHILELKAKPSKLYAGKNLQEVNLKEFLEDRDEKIFILGEYHDQTCHHQNHIEFLETLYALNQSTDKKIHIAMEFLDFQKQKVTDDFIKGKITEEEFLKEAQWSGDFDNYRRKVLFARETQARTFAINAPRFLTRAISQEGIENIDDELKTLLPPDFQLGNQDYFQRFVEVMTGGGHQLPDEVIDRYFQAQSVWDDTMAHYVKKWSERYPNDFIVVIVGDFHVAHGGGLPHQLEVRGAPQALTLSQMLHDDSSDSRDPAGPWGKRADLVWVCGD